MSGQARLVDRLVKPDAGPVIKVAGASFQWTGPRAFGIEVKSLTVAARERLLLVGPSGSGKSTLLSLLAGIIVPSSGSLSVLGTETTKLSRTGRDRFRAEHFGIVFQMFNLLPYGSVIDNVVLPLSFAPGRRSRADKATGSATDEASRLLAALGLARSEYDGMAASRLSVGQQQRVAAARALIGRPEIIIADEPTSALDRNRQQAFLDLLFSEVEAAGAALIMVSHEEAFAPRFDRTLTLGDVATTTREGGMP